MQHLQHTMVAVVVVACEATSGRACVAWGGGVAAAKHPSISRWQQQQRRQAAKARRTASEAQHRRRAHQHPWLPGMLCCWGHCNSNGGSESGQCQVCATPTTAATTAVCRGQLSHVWPTTPRVQRLMKVRKSECSLMSPPPIHTLLQASHKLVVPACERHRTLVAVLLAIALLQ